MQSLEHLPLKSLWRPCQSPKKQHQIWSLWRHHQQNKYSVYIFSLVLFRENFFVSFWGARRIFHQFVFLISWHKLCSYLIKIRICCLQPSLFAAPSGPWSLRLQWHVWRWATEVELWDRSCPGSHICFPKKPCPTLLHPCTSLCRELPCSRSREGDGTDWELLLGSSRGFQAQLAWSIGLCLSH